MEMLEKILKDIQDLKDFSVKKALVENMECQV